MFVLSRFRVILCLALSFVLFPMLPMSFVYGQSEIQKQIDASMTPDAGQKGGALQKKELLLTALKREKVESNSIRLAIQSMDDLLDFRLSRAGDRYVFEVGSDRKLIMLRYERDKHVYETRLDSATNRYVAHLVDLDAYAVAEKFVDPQPSNEAMEDDGEVDVERQVIAPSLAQNAGELKAGDSAIGDSGGVGEWRNSDTGESALANRPSPDSEYPDGNVPDWHGDDAEENVGHVELFPEHEEVSEKAEGFRLSESSDDALPRERSLGVEAPNIDVKGYKNANLGVVSPYPDASKMVQIKYRSDDRTEYVVGIVMFVSGALMFLFGLFAVCIPKWRMKRRCRAMGLSLVDSFDISPKQKLCVVEWNGSSFILLVSDKVQFVVSADDDGLFEFLKKSLYWHEMAQNPVSDRQFSAMLNAYRLKQNASGTTRTHVTHDLDGDIEDETLLDGAEVCENADNELHEGDELDDVLFGDEDSHPLIEAAEGESDEAKRGSR